MTFHLKFSEPPYLDCDTSLERVFLRSADYAALLASMTDETGDVPLGQLIDAAFALYEEWVAAIAIPEVGLTVEKIEEMVAKKLITSFDRIVTPRFTKSAVTKLSAYGTDLRQILCDNAIKDLSNLP